MEDIGCILFDFDGTLADTSEGIIQTEKAMLQEMGLPVGDEARMRSGIGLPLRGSLKMGNDIPEERLDEAVETYRRLFDVVAIGHIVAFDGVVETLEGLQARGVRMGVATSRSGRTLRYLCERLGILRYFEELASVECAARPKPAPDTVFYLLEKMQVTEDETLVVVDTVFDLQMGREAGCRTCGVTYGNHSRAQLEAAAPDWIIDDIRGLLSL